MSRTDDLTKLRAVLAPLVESFELDDPDTGVVAWIPVVGGTFVHPLSREQIPRLKVYGAGPDRVKIAEPKFMRSLPTVPVAGLRHPSQLCAMVAKMMGETLGELGRIRDTIAGMGISLDLEHDVLRLRGRLELRGILVELVTSQPGELTIAALGQHPLSALRDQERRLPLTGQPAADLDELAKLVRRLDDTIRRETLEQMEQSLGLLTESDDPSDGPPDQAAQDSPAVQPQVASQPVPPADAQAGPTTGVDLGSGWGELIPGSEPAPAQPGPESTPGAEPAPAPEPLSEPASPPEPEVVPEAEVDPEVEVVPDAEAVQEPEPPPPEPEPTLAPEAQAPEPGVEPPPEPAPDSAPSSSEAPAPRFAEGGSDVVELTELVEEIEVVEPVADTEAPQSPATGDQAVPQVAPDPSRLPGAQEPAAAGGQMAPVPGDDLFAPGSVATPPPPEPSEADREEALADSKPPAEDFPPLRIDYLFEATGGDTEVSAHNGRLRLKVPFRVVQGEYTFYLEQVAHKQFNGFLVSPTGTRHKVEVDFTAIMDIKEIFDKVMLG